jgi:hypothetical protein
MDTRQVQSDLVKLLLDSKIDRPEVVEDVKQSINAGEVLLAFETICSWIYEDSISLTLGYFRRLTELSEVISAQKVVERLADLVEG